MFKTSARFAAAKVVSANKRNIVSTVKWVQGKSLIRVAIPARVKSVQSVGIIRPSAIMLSINCDRCRGTRHTDRTLLCSATLKRPTPFVDPDRLYSVSTGKSSRAFEVVNVNLVGRSLVGTAVLAKR
tara:strand:- start:49271 stop:49651 length:381 start_codon:yes stop_codon:yes gene_type:complete